MQQDANLLESLGYEKDDKATNLLEDLILEVNELLENNDEKEIEKLVNNKKSFIYVELACFDHEIGLNKFNQEIERIHKTRKIENIDIETYTNVYGNNYDPTVNDTIISVAKFMKIQKQLSENNKVYAIG